MAASDKKSPAVVSDDSDFPLAVRVTRFARCIKNLGSMSDIGGNDNFPLCNPPVIYQLLFSYLINNSSVEPPNLDRIITNIYELNPMRLADEYGVAEGKEWWFFTLRGRDYKSAKRIKLAGFVGDGYWELVFEDKFCKFSGLPGLCRIRFYRFYYGGNETSFYMNVYSLGGDEKNKVGDWVLCKLFNQKGDVTFKRR